MVQEAIRRATAAADANRRRTGMSRRDFLVGICGAATTLLALQACSKESSGGNAGGRYDLPPEAGTDPDAARSAIGGDELVIDVQGHLLDYGLRPQAADFGSGFPQARCGEADPRDCFSIEHFLTEVFLRSDTDVAVLSSIPVAGDANPLTIEVMEEARRVATALCGDGRILMQGQAIPNIGRLEAALESMEDVVRDHRIGAWKAYTHSPAGRGWRLDDATGDAFVRKVAELGVPTICVHKGLSGGDRWASPADFGPAAARHPDVRFVAYHSGYETGVTEGPYDPEGQGVDRLVRTVLDNGIRPNTNVYAELGSTWWNLMRSPTEAAHVLGKLLLHIGEDNLLWGTDSIWYGSPQGQIQAFRAFEIAAELQERHRYPALTADVKAKVLGRNAARLYGVDPDAAACRFDRRQLEEIRRTIPGRDQAYGPRTSAEVRALIDAHGGLL